MPTALETASQKNTNVPPSAVEHEQPEPTESHLESRPATGLHITKLKSAGVEVIRFPVREINKLTYLPVKNQLGEALKKRKPVTIIFEGECHGGDPKYVTPIIEEMEKLLRKRIPITAHVTENAHVVSGALDVLYHCDYRTTGETKDHIRAHGSEEERKSTGLLDRLIWKAKGAFSSIFRSARVAKRRGVGSFFSYLSDLRANTQMNAEAAIKKGYVQEQVADEDATDKHLEYLAITQNITTRIDSTRAAVEKTL